ncbi:MAG: SRPBCC domain-containing protein [Acidimicrobiia bacterium]
MKDTDLIVRKEIVIERGIDETFRVFTEELGEWWPLDAGHSVLEGDAVTAALEARTGGRIYESTADGREAEWGSVVAVDPPHGITIRWHPGYGRELGTTLVVRFEAIGNAVTRLELVHSGWEVHGSDAERIHSGYTTGWDFVLGEFGRQLAG